MLRGWKVNRMPCHPPSSCFLGPGPKTLRTGKEGQGLLGPRSSLAENPRARHIPAGRTSPGPGLRRRPRPRWEFEQGRASGKQMPGRWARPDTHLASQKSTARRARPKIRLFTREESTLQDQSTRPTCACRRPFQEPHLAHSLALPGPLYIAAWQGRI